MNNTNNSQLGYYLAGLIEGDGSIWTSKSFKSTNGRKYNPIIIFTFHKNEFPLFEFLKENLGGGSFYRVKSTNVGRYRICDNNTLIKVINLVNGKFRTPKIKYLYRAIDQINLKHGSNIIKLPLDTTSLDSNPWLAGFTDADGNFHISLEGVYGSNNSLARGRVKCTFTVTQRIIDKPTGLSCVSFMKEIADFFQCKINYKSVNTMAILAQTDKKHYLTKAYFNTYPLMTSKWLNYLCFLQGLNYLGRRLTDKEVIEIQRLKNSMNNKRIYYNWDHLKNFYK